MRFSLRTLLYSIAVLAAGMGTFGRWGIGAACGLLAVWGSVFFLGLRGKGWGWVAGVLIVALTMLCVTAPYVDEARESSRSWQCHYGMSTIAKALLLYAKDHGALPPVYIAGADGKPMHSWRVLILPYLEGKNLYDQYDFSEPWNGPNNSALAPYAPTIFQCPSDPSTAAGTTSYFAVVGPRTAWPSEGGRRLDEFTDGPEQTLLLMEAKGRGVNWLDPRDISYTEALRLLTADNAEDAQSAHTLTNSFAMTKPARNIALADGSALLSRIGWSKSAAEAVLSVSGGEDAAGWIARQRAAQRPGPNLLAVLLFLFLALLPFPWAVRRYDAIRASDAKSAD